MYNSQYESIIDGSSVITDPKGYYEFDKMTGRKVRRYNYMHILPEPSDYRFERINTDVNKKRVSPLVPFYKNTGREKMVVKKEFYSSPNYYPSYELTMKKASSVPIIEKLLGRKPEMKPNYCSNNYDIQKKDLDVVYVKKKVPNFSKMYGREGIIFR